MPKWARQGSNRSLSEKEIKMHDELDYGILSVSGDDKVGIGATASCFLLDNKANILEEFGVVLNPKYAIESFVFEAKAVNMRAMTSSVDSILNGLKPLIIPIGKPPEDGYEPFIYTLEIVAVDRPGIAATIERELADLGINIRHVEGRRKKLTGTDEAIYTGSFRVKIPPESLMAIRELVETMTRDFYWDIDLRPEKSWCGTNNLIPLFHHTMASINAVDPPLRRWEP